MSKGKTDLDLEWENRTLCSDGNCIGVIGPDGRCRECGKPHEGELPEPGVLEEHAPDGAGDFEAADESDPEPSKEAEASSDTPEGLDSDWESRRLCSDGNCIGVIGPDGKCKECGKPPEGTE